jgi:hypothetical protein
VNRYLTHEHCIIIYFIAPRFPTEYCFWSFPDIGGFFLLVRVTLDDDEYRACAELYWQGRTEVLIKKLLHSHILTTTFYLVLMANHCWNWLTVFQNYNLKLVQAKLSQCYDTINIKFDYSGVEVFFHAFSSEAQDGNVPLNSTSDGYLHFPTEWTNRTPWIGGMAWQRRKKGLYKRKFSRKIIGKERLSFRPYASRHIHWADLNSK